MVNWLSFVKDYREKHPEVSYKEALTICSPLYKKSLSQPKVVSASCSSTEEVVERPESKPVSTIKKPKRKTQAKKKPKSVEVKIQIQSESTSETNHSQ